MPVQDNERDYFNEMRMIEKDDEGRDILRGLTYEETEWYLTYSRDMGLHNRSIKQMEADRDRYADLFEKHETARHAILAAEYLARVSNPTKH